MEKSAGLWVLGRNPCNLVIFLRQIVSAGGSAAVTAVDPGVWNPDPERRKAHKDPSGKRKTGGV